MLLKEAGYVIGFIGKYGVGNNPPGEQFDFWSCTERGQPPYWYKTGGGRKIHHTDSVANDIQEFLDWFKGAGDAATTAAMTGKEQPDRKSVVSGKSVSVRVDLGGRRIIKKKKHE